jgi:hypothetical protein
LPFGGLVTPANALFLARWEKITGIGETRSESLFKDFSQLIPKR